MRYELRPLDYGGILDRTIELYRHNFALLFAISCMVYVPLGGMQMGVLSWVGRPTNDPSKAFEVMLPYMAIGLLAQVLTFFATGAITIVMAYRYLGYPITFVEAWAAVVRAIVPLFLTTLLVGLLTVIGFIFLIVPGLIVMIWSSFVTQVVLLERTYYMDAIQRSKNLIGNGQWVRVLMLGFIIFILAFILGAAAEFAGGFVAAFMSHPEYLQVAISSVMQAAVFPLGMIAQTLLYYDIRVRREAFDLQMLAGSFGMSLQPPAQQQWQQTAYQQHYQQYQAQAPTQVIPEGSTTFCHSCGGIIPASARFCTLCGQTRS